MTIAFPRTDVMTAVGYEDQSFVLTPRQELSRTAGGMTVGKDFGTALWFGSWTTAPLLNDDALMFEAILNSLDGVIRTFEAGDLRRPYPRLHADGDFNDTGEIESVADGRRIALKDLDAGMKLSVGDYLSFDVGGRRMLHQVMEAATASGSGVTGLFEVRPYLVAGTAADISVRLKRPCGLFVLTPDSIRQQIIGGLHTKISFQAVQSL